MDAREGTTIVQVTKDDLYKMSRTQREILADGIINPDTNKLEQGLSTFASVLGFFVLKLPTAYGVALSAVSLGLGMTSNDKESYERVSVAGEHWLESMEDFMIDHPTYDLIEIEYPYLEYLNVDGKGENIKICQGGGLLLGVHTNGGWI